MAGLDEFVDNKIFNRPKPPKGSSNFFDENMVEFRPNLDRNNIKEYREKSQSEETLLRGVR